MAILNHVQIDQLITAVTDNPADLANIMYAFFQRSNLNTKEQRISALMDVIGHFKTYSSFSKAFHMTKAAGKVVGNRSEYLNEIREILGNKQDERAIRSEKILAVILRNSSMAKDDKAQELESEEIDENVDKVSEKLKEEQSFKLKSQHFEDYIKKNNKKLIVEYRKIIANIHVMASLLLSPTKASSVPTEKKLEHEILLNQIIKHIKSIDQASDFDYTNLPIAIEYLVSYVSYLVTIEIDIQKSLKGSDKIVNQEKNLRESLSYAGKMLNALSKFLEILLNIKNTIQKFFGANKVNVEEERKKLTVFYDSIDPNLDQDIKAIKFATSTLQKLPIRPKSQL